VFSFPFFASRANLDPTRHLFTFEHFLNTIGGSVLFLQVPFPAPHRSCAAESAFFHAKHAANGRCVQPTVILDWSLLRCNRPNAHHPTVCPSKARLPTVLPGPIHESTLFQRYCPDFPNGELKW
jgi:hypothetical protein